MARYRCDECHKTFKEDEASSYRENVGEFWGSPAYETFYVCPYCGCDSIAEVVEISEDDDEYFKDAED